MCSALATCREPWNITCSNRWAKPVLPGTSCFEPTSYQRLTATTGREVVLGDDQAQAVGEALVGEGDGRDMGRHAWAPMLVEGVDRSAFGGCRPGRVGAADDRRGAAAESPVDSAP